MLNGGASESGMLFSISIFQVNRNGSLVPKDTLARMTHKASWPIWSSRPSFKFRAYNGQPPIRSTLEGKGRTPTDNYDVIQTQMLAWCRRGLANNNNAVSQFSCWAVGVSGYFVKFYAFDPLNPSSDGTQGQLVRLGIDRDPTTGAPNICKCERLAQVITTDPKWADVQAMMELISQRPIIDSAYIQALPARRPTGMDIE
jgi:hypothetical protein